LSRWGRRVVAYCAPSSSQQGRTPEHSRPVPRGGARAQFQATRANKLDRAVIDRSARLKRWAKLLNELIPNVHDAYMYANNHYAGFGPQTIRELAKRIR
jgi:uncharacterized protein YecE (DUF72 family)